MQKTTICRIHETVCSSIVTVRSIVHSILYETQYQYSVPCAQYTVHKTCHSALSHRIVHSTQCTVCSIVLVFANSTLPRLYLSQYTKIDIECTVYSMYAVHSTHHSTQHTSLFNLCLSAAVLHNHIVVAGMKIKILFQLRNHCIF